MYEFGDFRVLRCKKSANVHMEGYFQTVVTSSSSSSDYDYECSSSSSDEDSKVPEMKISTAESRAKMDHSAEMKRDVPLNNHRRRISATEEKLQSRAKDVASDSDASEDEPEWVPPERKIKPDRRTKDIEKLVQADLEAECEEEDYWEMMYSDPDIHPDFVNSPNNDSDEELEEDSAKHDDDESDNSDKSDDSDD
ncbi:dentin sialophosphoprotein-like [Papaver somniferum]|uniref:dentin sialophosphoprotein-like n=1 Tax=Papaver somniferum TaxID=3469 RepID=UPI000E6FEC3E|nr:dentin sialophosphoprotein-like [Papaver somniferum]